MIARRGGNQVTIQELFPQARDAAGDDRLPPQDLHAEQSVLGGMLLSKDAIADCVEVLRAIDFYRPQHEAIFDAVLSLYGRGEPADAITVADELGKRGDLGRVGGQAYLHQLISSVPTAANAGYYAQIVAERAVLRRLVEAGTKIVQLGYAQGGGDVEDIVNAAQAEVYAVVDKRGAEDYHRLGDILEMTVDEIEVASGKSGEMTGVPTGFTDLDSLTNGLHPGQMIVVAARPAIGKALALDTPLPTPTGWTTMGGVEVGDYLLGADGQPTRVIAATEVMNNRPCYELVFADGERIIADGQHQWLTERHQRTFAAVRTTEEIAATLRTETAEARLNHSVALAAPLDLPEADLPLSPYVLGAWLGDGATDAATITTADDELVMYLEAEGLVVTRTPAKMRYSLRFPERRCCRNHQGTVQALLRSMGVLGNKHIPATYLRGGEAQRRALLAGLLDTDGTVRRTGSIQLTTTSVILAEGYHELVVGLGYRANVMRKPVKGRTETSSVAYTINFTSNDDVFRLSRKSLLHKEVRTRTLGRRKSRFIVDVRRIASVPVRCIEIDNHDHLYLAGRSMIPTHNSTLGLDIVRSASIKHNLASVIFSLEMSKTEITMRLLSAEAGIQLQHMRKGTMREEDWTRLASTMGRVSDAPLFIDDSPNMSLMEIRAKCRRLKQRNNLKLVVIDYLQLMSSGKKVESRQQEVSEFSRALKLLAKELEVPVVAISQLNRGPEQRTDKKPQMSDLRESGCLTAETRVLRADTGGEVSMGELVAAGATDVPVWSLDESLRYVRRHLTHVFSTGVRPVFRLTLASGKQVRATENHPFLTYTGWRALGDLRTGDRLAVPRHVPAPQAFDPWEDEHVILLAHMLGDGSMLPRQPLRYASIDAENLAAVSAAALTFGVVAVRDDDPAARFSTLRMRAPFRVTHGRRNPIVEWLDNVGVYGLRSHEKFVPEGIFHVSKRQIGLFLKHIWATEGSVTVNKSGRGGRVYYASTSRRLVDDLSRLLLRFGISTRVRTTRKEGYRPGYTLDISGADSQRRFLQEIGVHGSRGEAAERLLAAIRGTQTNTTVDTVPVEVWDTVRSVMTERGMTSRDRLGRVAAVLDGAELELHAVNDVLWDEVISVQLDRVEEVFDATVVGGHNFVANGIAVHNSIEQDADMVILLHREEAYERESPRAGEADLIVAKHRNGPTDTIVLAFQGHYSRFTNMAPSF
jgi:replicative DNA helicase